MTEDCMIALSRYLDLLCTLGKVYYTCIIITYLWIKNSWTLKQQLVVVDEARLTVLRINFAVAAVQLVNDDAYFECLSDLS